MRKLDSKFLRIILIGLLAIMVVMFFAITFGGLSVLKTKSKQVVDLKLQGETADSQAIKSRAN